MATRRIAAYVLSPLILVMMNWVVLFIAYGSPNSGSDLIMGTLVFSLVVWWPIAILGLILANLLLRAADHLLGSRTPLTQSIMFILFGCIYSAIILSTLGRNDTISMFCIVFGISFFFMYPIYRKISRIS